MGKKEDQKHNAEGREKKRGKKKKSADTSPIEEALACPPSAKFFWELVVGNGIGEDTLEAYRRALDSRREKALSAAQQHMHESGKNCCSTEHLILGPFPSPQQWRIENEHPARYHLEQDRIPVASFLPFKKIIRVPCVQTNFNYYLSRISTKSVDNLVDCACHFAEMRLAAYPLVCSVHFFSTVVTS